MTWPEKPKSEEVAVEDLAAVREREQKEQTAAQPASPAAPAEQKKEESKTESSSTSASTTTTERKLVANPTVSISSAADYVGADCAKKLIEALKEYDSKTDWEKASLETDSVAWEGSWQGFVIDTTSTNGTRFTQVWWDSDSGNWSIFDFTV